LTLLFTEFSRYCRLLPPTRRRGCLRESILARLLWRLILANIYPGVLSREDQIFSSPEAIFSNRRRLWMLIWLPE